jgi:putative hydrolase of the HAD superfamily
MDGVTRIRAILFDYGGTLDGPASYWRDRFVDLYRAAGLDASFDAITAAFAHATRCGYAESDVKDLDLRGLVEFHVTRQLEHLRVADHALAVRVAAGFLARCAAALAVSRTLLERLRGRGIPLGVVSNFYGNLRRVLDDAGLAPYLSAIVDSTCVGVSKPDPRIFAIALDTIGTAPAETLYVGDSFDKDVLGAHAAGLRTGWLVGLTTPPCPAPELVDFRLRQLEEVEAVVG